MSFDNDLQRFITRTGLEADIVIRKIVLKAFEMVTRKTPVKTGRAKGNWNVSISSIDRSVDMSATSTPRGSPAVAPYLKKGDGLKTNYIVNSLPYITVLEYGRAGSGKGRSEQAPNGMVRVTVNELRSYFK